MLITLPSLMVALRFWFRLVVTLKRCGRLRPLLWPRNKLWCRNKLCIQNRLWLSLGRRFKLRFRFRHSCTVEEAQQRQGARNGGAPCCAHGVAANPKVIEHPQRTQMRQLCGTRNKIVPQIEDFQCWEECC